MSVSRQKCWVVLAGVVCMIWSIEGLGQRSILDVSRMGSLDGAMAQRLQAAGYELDEPSLIRALLFHSRVDSQGVPNALIPVGAATFLGRLPKSEKTVEALLTASSDPVEVVAIAAMRALHWLGEPQWRDVARGRLLLVDPIYQLELAILLGEARQADGWSLVLKALREDTLGLRSRAMQGASSFDGVTNVEGQTIDVVAELEALRAAVPAAAAQFTEGIERVRQQRENQRIGGEIRQRAAPQR